MRLICPNCGAQYEVADNAIPAAGRDVQCSNCGHGWFQHREETTAAAPQVEAATVADAPGALDAAESDVPEVTETANAAPATAPEPVMQDTSAPAAPLPPEPEETADADADADVVAAPVTSAPAQRSLDENLLAVLREEAEREVEKRKADASRGLEVQTDLGLDNAPPAPKAPPPAPLQPGRASDFSHLSSESDLLADPAVIPEASVRPAARRDLLPDVEVISSTLRSSGGGDDDNPMPDLPPIRRASGFRSGFLLAIVVAVFAVVAYALAPRLAVQFPGAKGGLDAYVAGVDGLRLWIGSVVASVNGRLES